MSRTCTFPGSTAVVASPPRPLYLDVPAFRVLLEQVGPSLGLWRAAEVAVLRERSYARPILDLGCGDGLVSSLVFERVEVGLDPFQPSLARAARRGVYDHLQPVPMEEAPLSAGCIGTVVSNSVLEHVAEIDTILEATARVLRPGGQLVFTTPTDAFSAWLVLPLGCYAAWRNRQYHHLNLWPVEEWTRRLERVGLEVVAVRPYLRRGLVATWDALDVLQQVWIARRRVASLLWQRLPPAVVDYLARWVAGLDLSAPALGGGRLMVARRV